MAESNNYKYVQPAIPKFDGHYDHWTKLMENFLCSKEYWHLVEHGISVVADKAIASDIELKLMEEQQLKDLKINNYLYQAIDREILDTILNDDTSKKIWDSMKQKFQGSTRVKRAQLQALRRDFEMLHMKEGEIVNSYFARTLKIAKSMKACGESMRENVITAKILRSMTPKFNYVVCSIEESNNLDIMTIDELQSSLLVHEQRMTGQGEEEQVLQITNEDRRGRGRGRGSFRGRGRGRGSFRGRGRGRQSFNKAEIECFKCHKLGHFQYECPTWEKKINYAKVEDMVEQEDELFNHMSGNKEWFSELDENFRHIVKLNNDTRIAMMGKGSICRQLIATYSPQQNGVAKRKNKIIMNMMRSMLIGKQVPKIFWPEATRWCVHILNRCPTAVVQDKTPEEAWSGVKPIVDYFRNWEQNEEEYQQDILDWGEGEESVSDTEEQYEENVVDNTDARETREQNEENVVDSSLGTREGLSDDDGLNVMMVTKDDPSSFEEAIKSKKWRDAMMKEMKSIDKNKT
ncbi:Copia protein, partial [Mucuna pruriens]